MTNKYWLFCLLVLSIISFASISASNEFVTAPQYGAASHSANNQPQWVPSNAAASSSSAVACGDDHSHSGDGYTHSSPSSLTAHHGRKQSLTEDTSKTFVCTLCSHRFRRQEHLKRHYHSIHTHDKPFECTDCGKKFSRSDNVDQYQRTHEAGTVVMGVMTSESGIHTTWWIALVVISVVMFIHKIYQSCQRVNNIARQRSALKLYLRNNYEVKDDPDDSTSSDGLDHINDQDAKAFVPAIYRRQPIRTGQTFSALGPHS